MGPSPQTACLLILAALVASRQAFAQTPSVEVLNRQGLALLDAGRYEEALDRFQRSRAEAHTFKNTTNAAICLHRLGRYDEAMELYEELLEKFYGELKEQNR